MEAATDIQELRKAVRSAETGTGSVRRAIQSATFFITGRNFTGLIRSFRNSREWEKALEIFEAVRMCGPAVGDPASFYTFSATISVCSKSGKLEEALWLLREMKAGAEEDPSLQPDAAVYRLIILCCIKQARCNDAVDLLDEMWQKGLHADDDTLKKVLQALIQGKSFKRAVRVLDSLHASDVVLSVEQYGDFIKSAVEEDSYDVAIEVFLMMQMAGIEPDKQCCDSILLSSAQSGDLDVTIPLLEGMSEFGIPISNRMYACVLEASIKTREMESGLRVVRLMEKHSD